MRNIKNRPLMIWCSSTKWHTLTMGGHRRVSGPIVGKRQTEKKQTFHSSVNGLSWRHRFYSTACHWTLEVELGRWFYIRYTVVSETSTYICIHTHTHTYIYIYIYIPGRFVPCSNNFCLVYKSEDLRTFLTCISTYTLCQSWVSP
jgi:hypothetical protein